MAVKIRSGFGSILRSLLEEKKVTLRELARRLAIEDGTDPETMRRKLNRYIAGTGEPSRNMRHRVARALEVDASSFDEDAERAAEIQQIHSAMLGLAETLHDLAVRARAK